MNVVESWTGAHASALRAALRLTNESFAEHLGTATRTVANWSKAPGVVPRPELQRALDTALHRASEEERSRFDLLCQTLGGDSAAAPAEPVGWVIERQLSVSIDIAADGWATVTYRHELVNETKRAFSRLQRFLWFETTKGALNLTVLPETGDDRHVMIQRIHESPSMTTFACQILPALEPSEAATISYRATGGRFVQDHYWRQTIARPTAALTITLRHSGMDLLGLCTATEELSDGSEVSAADGLFWTPSDDGVVIGLTRYNLGTNQAITLRWGPT